MLSKLIEIEGHSGAIYTGMTFNDILFTAGSDRYLVAWNYNSGKQLPFVVKNDYSIYSVNQIDDNFVLIGDSNGGLHVIDYQLKKELKNYQQHKSAIFKIEVNPHLNHFYLADADGNLSVWDSQNFNLLLFLPLTIGKIRSLSIINEGKFLVVGAQDGLVRTFDTTNFNEIKNNFVHSDGVTSILEFKNNSILTGGKDAYLRLLDNDLKVLKAIPAHNYAIYDLLNLGDYYVSCSRDKSIKIWDNELNFITKKTAKEGGHRHSVNKLVKLSSSTFASMGDDKRIIIWNLIK